mmetsp:Transcript_24391/g.78664  ORF Transcript_24391/g.78664 Transcript_24391/m.78664 type:complete len:375 (-) Transcript_24391:1780-2904(-)
MSESSTCVSSWCVAATEMEQGSATRNPVRVEKQRDTDGARGPVPPAPESSDALASRTREAERRGGAGPSVLPASAAWFGPRPGAAGAEIMDAGTMAAGFAAGAAPTAASAAAVSLTTRPRWVSTSDATAKTCLVCARSILAHARVAKVPPEWESRSTTAPSICRPSSIGWPSWGMGTFCPNRASSLLLDTARARSAGRAVRRSETNCSPTHRLTSQPATSRSTLSFLAPSRSTAPPAAAASPRCASRSRRAAASSRATRWLVRAGRGNPPTSRAPAPSSPNDSRSEASVGGSCCRSSPTGSSTVGGSGNTIGLSSSGMLRRRSVGAAAEARLAPPDLTSPTGTRVGPEGLAAAAACVDNAVLLKVSSPLRPSEK